MFFETRKNPIINYHAHETYDTCSPFLNNKFTLAISCFNKLNIIFCDFMLKFNLLKITTLELCFIEEWPVTVIIAYEENVNKTLLLYSGWLFWFRIEFHWNYSSEFYFTTCRVCSAWKFRWFHKCLNHLTFLKLIIAINRLSCRIQTCKFSTRCISNEKKFL